MDFNQIKMIVYDFDGVMTDNNVFLDSSGSEFVKVNRSDGLGVKEIKNNHIKQIILTTEKVPIAKARANKLGLDCFNDIADKAYFLKKYCIENKISLSNVAYVGNDINDLDAIKLVGMKICPSDAYKPILEICDLVLQSKGGEGVIRELAGYISDSEIFKTN